MVLYIPYAYTPYEFSVSYGVFSTYEQALEVLNKRKADNYYECYEIYETKLDTEDIF